MLKKCFWFVLSFALCLSACGAPFTAGGVPPSIERHPVAANWGRGALTTMPTYDPDSEDGWQVDLRSHDISGLDLRNSLDNLMFADFDARTVWPAAGRMPAAYDPQRILELGKNPGLGIRDLHQQGITGKGVGLAIIDQPLLVDHQEYVDRLRLYEEINVSPTTEAQMHGAAVTSIAVGKTVGVAPEANLYYIGSWTGDWGSGAGDFTWNFTYYAQAIRRILEINRGLPENQKIRVIAIQVGWQSGMKGYDEITAAVKEAKTAGILVVSSSLEQTFGFKFHGLGRSPLADPDKFESYEPGLFWAKEYYTGGDKVAKFYSDRLLVPMDSRTTASPTGKAEYVFYREGGWSWSIPYIAGMYALACQVDPSITPDRFWEMALQTGRRLEITHEGQTHTLGPILDPAALIGALKR